VKVIKAHSDGKPAEFSARLEKKMKKKQHEKLTEKQAKEAIYKQSVSA